MMVINWNGKETVLTGWRAWLAAAAVFVGLTLIFGLIAFLFVGIAITAGAVLLIVVPVAVGVAILASLFRSPAGR